MEIVGSTFTITLGAWRFRLSFSVEETEPQAQTTKPFANAGFSNEKPSLFNVKR